MEFRELAAFVAIAEEGGLSAASRRLHISQPVLSQTVNGSTAMLHDGRARNPTEAILWHGGEAASAREAFRNMSKADREALLKFLSSVKS